MDDFSPDTLTRRMIREQIVSRGMADPRVLTALSRVPRHVFLPHLTWEEAYADKAVPSLDGQTVSQPYIVALMSGLLDVHPGHRVLEIGTGLGYQTAILVELGGQVVTVESNPRLAHCALATLTQLGCADRVTIVTGDGTLGYAALSPYDRILVTAAAPHVPTVLKQQLADEGLIVIPEGPRDVQQLRTYQRRGDAWTRRDGISCRFVPLIGGDGWRM
ncbi:MAG: protein-L-isoaspartate(D-aspartate) O-methyltransferase [Phycisphaeraceae bacterium]|nr:protein-L-isoaspartate(D-aspartate) O-methyltransferase [Phycisphaeraceae bacterium]